MENDKTPNVWINPVYLEVLEALERLTGKTPSEFVNSHVEGCIVGELDGILVSFPAYLEKTAKRLGVEV